MQVNHQQSNSLDRGSGIHLQHALEAPGSFTFSNMQDMNQQVLPLDDAIRTSRLNMYEVYNERSDAIKEFTMRAEEEKPVVYRRRRWRTVKGKELIVYSRMKWTDEMVKLLITAVSYVGEDVWSNGAFPKEVKWGAISNAMTERGHRVSPLRCEVKFNELNKKFKRLNDILGSGTACSVVQDPAIMEMLDLTCDEQEEVVRLLSSKQLFYLEMYSYNNQNRLFLPYDFELQQSVLSALEGKDSYEPQYVVQDIAPANSKIVGEERISDRLRDFPGSDPNSCGIQDSTNNSEAESSQKEHQIMRQLLQLEEQKLDIQTQILELENQRFNCLKFSRDEHRQIQKMKLDNKAMKLESKRLGLALKRCEANFQSE